MARIISASIDLTKIDKNKIQTLDKNGEPFKWGAKYYNVDITVNDDFNQFGQDVSIAESQTKSQRDAKEKRNYLGNGKTVWKDEGNAAPQNTPSQREEIPPAPVYDDLPF